VWENACVGNAGWFIVWEQVRYRTGCVFVCTCVYCILDIIRTMGKSLLNWTWCTGQWAHGC
jgi:hypothetical protein